MTTAFSARPTLFGRFHAPEPLSNLAALHRYTGTGLRAVDHEPKVGVLDQEDLFAQGIDTSVLVPGAPKADALGSCTEQANHSALSNVMTEARFFSFTGASSYDDVVGVEKSAIVSYARCTHQTGDPSQEWPPTDCGSSGQYIVSDDVSQGLVKGAALAHDAESICSLLQSDGLLVGQPFLNAWMEPDSKGFIDGDGSYSRFQSDMEQGVAGGHETYWSAIEAIHLTASGLVDANKTVIRARNSWSKNWGDKGSYRFHLSTFLYIVNYCDFRQLQAA